MPDLELSHVGSTGELRWLTGGDTGRFCASPESNARYFDRELYLEQALKEAEKDRKVSKDWQAEMDGRYERGNVIERRGERAGLWPVGLLDQFWEGAGAHHEGEALVAPPMATSVAAPVVVPVVAPKAAGKKRKRMIAGKGAGT